MICYRKICLASRIIMLSCVLWSPFLFRFVCINIFCNRSTFFMQCNIYLAWNCSFASRFSRITESKQYRTLHFMWSAPFLSFPRMYNLYSVRSKHSQKHRRSTDESLFLLLFRIRIRWSFIRIRTIDWFIFFSAAKNHYSLRGFCNEIPTKQQHNFLVNNEAKNTRID